jgi:hypothetical protein
VRLQIVANIIIKTSATDLLLILNSAQNLVGRQELQCHSLKRIKYEIASRIRENL